MIVKKHLIMPLVVLEDLRKPFLDAHCRITTNEAIITMNARICFAYLKFSRRCNT